jgi:histidine triad (HIT) family protein
MENVEGCIFCKIVSHELPAYIVYQNEKYLAFLDINPLSPGHVQVIPKEHHQWVWDVPNVGEYFEVVKKIALAQQKAFNTSWIMSKIVGDEVQHAHIWVFPNSFVQGDKKDFEGNADKIRAAIE